jgi:hypothetical protein
MDHSDKYGSPIDYVTAGKRIGRFSGPYYRPSELRARATDYFEYMRGKVWNRLEMIKGGDLAGSLVDVPTSCPLDLKGFLLFAGFGVRTWNGYKSNEAYEDVCEWIEMVIETQNFEGAVVGAYNANLIARRHKIADKQETTVTAAPEQITGMRIIVE